MMFRLPHLIFAENHEDPATAQVLNRILPKLACLGYRKFLDELPYTMDKKSFITASKREEHEYAKLVLLYLPKWNEEISRDTALKQMGWLPFDLAFFDDSSVTYEDKIVCAVLIGFCFGAEMAGVSIASSLVSAIQELKTQLPLAEKFCLLGEAILILIARHLSRREWIKFYEQTLPQESIHFEMIDENHGYDNAISMIPIRDDKMSKAYFDSSVPALGVIGAMHSQGIQARAVDMYEDKAVAATQFCFIHLYSRPPIKIKNNTSEILKETKKCLDDCRSGGTSLPLGIVPIDITNKSDKDIMDIIEDEIQKRQKAFYALAPNLKAQLAVEYETYIKLRSDENKKMFARFKGFFDVFTHMYADTKLSAAKKMIKLLTGTEDEKKQITFSPDEIAALRNKRLKKITDKLALFKILPEEFLNPKTDVASLMKL